MGLVLCAMLTVVASPTAAEVKSALGDAVGGGYQQELPGYERARAVEDPGTAPPRRERAPGKLAPRPRREPREVRVGGPMAAIAQVLMWGILVVGIALLAFWIIRDFSGYMGEAEVEDAAVADEDGDAVAQVVARPLGDAEALAAQGKYSEAIHALLLRTLQELVKRGQVTLPPSLTSREILGRVPLGADAREALSGLVLAVEVTHFGGAAPNADDYAMCRQHFDRFAHAYTRGLS